MGFRQPKLIPPISPSKFLMGLRITPIVLRLLILNIAVYVLLNMHVLDMFGLSSEQIYTQYFVLHKAEGIFPRAESFPFLPLQILTSFFTHGGLLHIFLNMWALINFGSIMEMVMGPRRFFAFYMFCGIVGGLITAFLDPDFHPVVGASGAIMGVMTAFGMYFPDQRLTFLIPIPITMSARNWMLTFGGISLLFVLMNAFHFGSSITGGISHFGHLAGMVAAVLFFYMGIGKYVK